MMLKKNQKQQKMSLIQIIMHPTPTVNNHISGQKQNIWQDVCYYIDIGTYC